MASSDSCSPPEDFPASERQKVMIINQLVQGRELATQLQALLAEAGDLSDEISAGDLVSRIMKSFTNTLFLVNQNAVAKTENDMSSSPADSPWIDSRAPKAEDSEESNCLSASSPARAPKDRRGSYKRRRTSKTWKTETPTLIDDGHEWRKYGQKVILKSDYPRNYFRCTHKYDQQCQAIKHVQRIQSEPPMYRTTYYGHHTCRNLLNGPELVLDCSSPMHDSSVLLSFNTANIDPNNLATKHPFFSPSLNSDNNATTHVKREIKDETLAMDVPFSGNVMNMVHNGSASASTDYLVLPHDDRDEDYLCGSGFDQSPGNMTMLSSNFESDIHGDVVSGAIDMDSFEDDAFVLQHLNF